MIVRLFLMAALYSTPLILFGMGVYHLVVRPRLRERDNRAAGKLNADHTCAIGTCYERVDPTSPDSVFENGRWYHRRCLKRFLIA